MRAFPAAHMTGSLCEAISSSRNYRFDDRDSTVVMAEWWSPGKDDEEKDKKLDEGMVLRGRHDRGRKATY